MKKTKAERPNHLKVIGTRIKPPVVEKDQFRALMAEVPVEWNFDSEEGETLLEYMREKIEQGATPEEFAQQAGMDDLAPLYREWAEDRG